jgi:carbon monoxide dehydrogenase subunit G
MDLQGERLIPASVDTTWAALNDPAVLKACIAGNLTMTNVQAPVSCTIGFDGQGGAAGFANCSADVALSAQGERQTLLKYAARAAVGGQPAQVEPSLTDAAAVKIAEDFFKAFEARVQSAQLAAAPLDALPAEADASIAKLWWLIGAVVVLAVVYFMIR